MPFTIVLDPRAVQDIQESIDYYEDQEPGLGRQLEHVDHYFSLLIKNPFFQVRYDSVHCLPLNRFPHMIHYTVNDEKKEITIRALFHTAKDPKEWNQKKEL